MKEPKVSDGSFFDGPLRVSTGTEVTVCQKKVNSRRPVCAGGSSAATRPFSKTNRRSGQNCRWARSFALHACIMFQSLTFLLEFRQVQNVSTQSPCCWPDRACIWLSFQVPGGGTIDGENHSSEWQKMLEKAKLGLVNWCFFETIARFYRRKSISELLRYIRVYTN